MRYLLLLVCCCCAFVTDKPAYLLYNQKLKPTSYQKLLKEASGADIVFFGELHNNPICHWLELQMAKDLHSAKKQNLIYGAEMFETDNQAALDDYLSGKSDAGQFKKDARLWNNYNTDYKPIVEFAKRERIPFIATNIPRRYASAVARKGLASLDTLSATDKAFIAPLPLTVNLELPGYKAMLDMMKDHGGTGPTGTNSSETAANFARAQAIKDATMADRILKAWTPGKTLLHFNGDYHSKNFEGIVWYLKQKNPALKIVTLSSIELVDITKPDKSNENLADFILSIPADMTKTY
ncbi:ChaN family lipoprotein [Tellurirhabdus bombi]|uniref:ChaN family lipoprotein n=1 Tax=Tellurirhabdus bombi TaxID=2907205 RepID=UPI001F398BC3|nr:ChaN family lipoprotein [Tellurirhabdus bombi]